MTDSFVLRLAGSSLIQSFARNSDDLEMYQFVRVRCFLATAFQRWYARPTSFESSGSKAMIRQIHQTML